MAGNEKIVELIIKARDDYSRVLKRLDTAADAAAVKQIQREKQMGAAAATGDAKHLERAQRRSQLESLKAQKGEIAATAQAQEALTAKIREQKNALRETAAAAKTAATANEALVRSANEEAAALARLKIEAQEAKIALAARNEEVKKQAVVARQAADAAKAGGKANPELVKTSNEEAAALKRTKAAADEAKVAVVAKTEAVKGQTVVAKQSAAAAKSDAVNSAAATRIATAQAAALEKTHAAAAKAKAALAGQREELQRLRGAAEGGFNAFSRTADAINAEALATERLTAELRDLKVAQQAATQNAARYKVAQKTSVGITNLQNAEREIQIARNLNSEIARVESELGRLRTSSRGSFAEFSRNADAMDNAAAAARNETVALREKTSATRADVPATAADSTAIQAGTSATRADTVATDANTAAKRRNATARHLMGSAQRGPLSQPGVRGQNQQVAMFGLRPWELTNLAYQVNDVVSGIAMGQKPAQIFAQQIGQLVQIFPKFGTALFGIGARLGGFAALLALPIIRLKTLQATVAQFSQELALSVDGNRYSAEGLGVIVESLRNAGVGLEDARKSVSLFVKEGFDEDQIERLILLSKGLARATGEEVPEAVAKLAAAFKGGRAEIRALDKDLNFLTAAQYEQINAMFASGREAEAYAEVQRILAKRFDEVAEKASGPWGNAIGNLGTAWRGLMDWLADTAPIQLAVAAFDGLGIVLENITGLIDRAINGSKADKPTVSIEAEFADDTDAELDRQIAELEEDLRKNKIKLEVNPTLSEGDAVFDIIIRDIAELERELNYLRSVRQIPEADRNLTTVSEFKDFDASGENYLDWMKDWQAANEKAKGDSEARKKIEIDVNAAIQERLDKITLENELAELTSREQFIQQEIIEAQNIAREAGLKLGEEELRQLREKLGLAFDQGEAARFFGDSGGGGNVGSFVDKVVGVESGGNANAQNPNSSATGLGQFITSTWLAMFRKYFPDRAAGMTEAAILALRKDAEMSRQMIELYARENAEVLRAAGVAVNEAALYLAHFLGPKGAAGLLAARSSTPVSDILSPDQISANQSILGGKTAGEVVAWAQKKMGITNAELAAQTRLSEIEGERTEKVEEYNEAYGKRIGTMEFELSLQGQQAREAAILTAIHEAEAEAIAAGTTLTKERRAEVAKLAGELFDSQNAEALAMADLNKILEQRKLLLDDLAFAQKDGDKAGAEEARNAIVALDAGLDAAIDKAIGFWKAMGGPEADMAIEKLLRLKRGLEDVGQTGIITGEQINNSLADGASSAFTALAEALARGENAWEAFRNAAMQALADVILEIGKAIVRQALLNALMGSGGPNGGVGGFFAGLVNGFVNHDGGIAGRDGTRRLVPSEVFANAMRYHSGGIAGLRPGEVPAILQRGEEVLTSNDPRHVANGGGGGSGRGLKIINAFDAAGMLDAALASSEGDEVFVNFVRANSQRLRPLLGIA